MKGHPMLYLYRFLRIVPIGYCLNRVTHRIERNPTA